MSGRNRKKLSSVSGKNKKSGAGFQDVKKSRILLDLCRFFHYNYGQRPFKYIVNMKLYGAEEKSLIM